MKQKEKRASLSFLSILFFSSDEQSSHCVSIKGIERIEIGVLAVYRFVGCAQKYNDPYSCEKSNKGKQPRHDEQKHAHELEGEAKLD